MKIVLFDIDGTLLWTKGAGRRAMERALKANIGTTGPADHRYDGKTDRQIVRESMSLERIFRCRCRLENGRGAGELSRRAHR